MHVFIHAYKHTYTNTAIHMQIHIDTCTHTNMVKNLVIPNSYFVLGLRLCLFLHNWRKNPKRGSTKTLEGISLSLSLSLI